MVHHHHHHLLIKMVVAMNLSIRWWWISSSEKKIYLIINNYKWKWKLQNECEIFLVTNIKWDKHLMMMMRLDRFGFFVVRAWCVTKPEKNCKFPYGTCIKFASTMVEYNMKKLWTKQWKNVFSRFFIAKKRNKTKHKKEETIHA